jgi:hypothetical protein
VRHSALCIRAKGEGSMHGPSSFWKSLAKVIRHTNLLILPGSARE